MILDAHTHVFPAIRGSGRHGAVTGLGDGWVSVGERRERLMPELVGAESRFTAAQLLGLMDEAGVGQAVLLQGSFYGECNAFALAAVKAHPDRFCAVAFLDPWQPDWRVTFDGILREPRFRGVKIEFSEETGLRGLHPGARMDDPALADLWAGLEQAGRVLTLDLGAVGSASYQTEAVRDIARRHPGLPIVVCHLAQPGPDLRIEAARLEAWRKQIELGCLPNVYFDTASLPLYFRHEPPFPDGREFIRRAVDMIGARKILWGSDAPGTLTLLAYHEYVALAKRHLDFLSQTDRNLVLGGNAARVYFATSQERI